MFLKNRITIVTVNKGVVPNDQRRQQLAFLQDVFAEIMHPEITKAMEAADAEPNADTPVPMPTADPEQFKTYQVPDEFMRVYKTLSTATEMMKNTWKRVLKNNQSYLSDPEKQKVLRFAMQ